MPSSTEKYYNIAPLTHIPLNRGAFFTYASEKAVSVGSLVSIPLGRKKIDGVVLSETDKPHFKGIKKIEKVVYEGMLSASQIELAHFIADYYISSLGVSLKLCVPKIIGTGRVKEQQENINPIPAVSLTDEQQSAMDTFHQKRSQGEKHFLLYGPTGSGKTEVYMQMIEDALSAGGQALLLVPEISLVPQNTYRFLARFPDKKIALLHSKRSAGERFKAWKNIRENNVDIIIGPRSALFAPVQDLKIIIIDEEHDQSFKQYDKSPRYHAIDIARFMADQQSIPLVLGSATPEVERFYDAREKKMTLLELTSRIHQDQMPEVEIIDMKEEFKKKNFSIFSEVLVDEMNAVLEEGRQIILFINRRGAASFVTCRTCGYVEECENCNLPYTYHIFGKNQGLQCHHCGKRKKAPTVCPECSSKAIKFLGGGTEKVFAALHSLFPKARIARMDKDTTTKKGSHEKIFTDFKNHEIDILVGTQMISKGWDLPKVNLVGIVSADVGLHFPDFRASEKAFQILTQVAGRTGRKHSRGKVVLQTYYPDHEVIQAVRTHDYNIFFKKDIADRKDLNYPPFSKIIKVIHGSKNERTSFNKCNALIKKLENFYENNDSVDILGPAPSFFSGINGTFIVHILIKFPKSERKNIVELLKKADSEFKIDVDPITLL